MRAVMHHPKHVELFGKASRKQRHERSDQTTFSVLLTSHDPIILKTRLPLRRSGDSLYGIRRVLLTGANLLTPNQDDRLEAVLTVEEHTQVDVTWWVYQRVVAAYRNPDRVRGRARIRAVITSLSAGVPAMMKELATLGRTLKRRAADVLAYFDRPGTSNGPTEAINGRLEHLRCTALALRNLTNYVARSLLEAGEFRPHLHSHLR